MRDSALKHESVTELDGATTHWRVGIDVGGTFTDVIAISSDGRRVMWKEDSTRERPADAVRKGLAEAARVIGVDQTVLLEGTDRLVHGSTIATNTIIEGTGPRVGLVCTEGFRDALYFRNAFKWDRYDLHVPRPTDFVDRHLRVGVSGRVDARGTVTIDLDTDGVGAAADVFARQGVEAVAVAFLWSSVNAEHEREARRILADTLSIPIVLSSDILPEVGEWVRTSATVLAAYVYRASAEYLSALQDWFTTTGLQNDMLIMQCNGGCATTARTLDLPIGLITSGPAAAPAAAEQVGHRAGTDDLITVDMGGTSFDVCMMRGGAVPRSREIMVEHQPIGIPGVEVHSIGAGGGSIAWVDSGGALRVGPESAGARPGPAAYGFGGDRPTVTDANVVLGYLSPDHFLAGRRRLRRDLATEAIAEHVARPLGLGVVAAAAGIVRIVNSNMVDAIRVVSVEKGIDPRPMTLVAGGGAGPLHAGRLASELGIRAVVIPAEAGMICAFGMTVADVRHDYAVLCRTLSDKPAVSEVAAALALLEERARADLSRSGFDEAEITILRSVDARYRGQIHDLSVAVPGGTVDARAFERVAAAFHTLHQERYSWQMTEHPIEYVHWRVAAVIATPKFHERRLTDLAAMNAEAAATGTRPAYFDDAGGFVDTRVYSEARYPAGGQIFGPSIVDCDNTTIVVFPGQRLTGDGQGTFLLDAASERAEPDGGA